MSPRKKSKAVDTAAPSLVLVAEKSQTKSFFKSISNIVFAVAGEIHITYGIREFIRNLSDFRFSTHLSVGPREWSKFDCHLAVVAFGFGGHVNLTLLCGGTLVSGGVTLVTPVVDMGIGGACHTPSHVLWLLRERREERAAEEARAARNERRRLNRRMTQATAASKARSKARGK